MPRNILIPDDLEATIRHACAVHAGQITYAQPALDGVLALIDDSHRRQRERAERHERDNATLAALIDPCTCGDPHDPAARHRYNGRPCLPIHRVD